MRVSRVVVILQEDEARKRKSNTGLPPFERRKGIPR
jgi:hypothetical protein